MTKQVLSVVLNNFENEIRVLKVAQSLQNNGYTVQVAAFHENGLKEKERIEGIAIHRIILRSKEWGKSSIVQAIKYIEFVIKTSRKYRKFEIIHCNDLNALPVGIMIKLFSKSPTKIVYDSHEYQAHRVGFSTLKSKMVFQLEKILLKFSDSVIVVSDSISDAYANDYKIEKPTVILNVPFKKNAPEKNNYFREKYKIAADDTIFLYQGRLTRSRGIEKIVEVFNAMPKQFHLVLMGHSTEMNQYLKNNLSSNNVHLHQAVKAYEILEYTVSADVGVALIEPVCKSYEYCLPNKIFEYTMAGVPIVTSNLPEMKRYIETNNLGITIDLKESASKIAKKLEFFCYQGLSQYKNHLEVASNQYNWENQEAKLLHLFRSLYAA